MVLSELAALLEQRLTLPLPGALAHEPMRATHLNGAALRFEHKLPPKPGAVLILLYPDEGRICFPLTKRQTYAGAHSGQISLPGGKCEPGETPAENALREAEEEIGIVRSDVHVIGALSDFFVMPSNFMVTPIVAYAETKPQFAADPYEVASIITGDLFGLLDGDAVRTKVITAAANYTMQAPHFEIQGEVVWGATSMILNELRYIVKELTKL